VLDLKDPQEPRGPMVCLALKDPWGIVDRMVQRVQMVSLEQQVWLEQQEQQVPRVPSKQQEQQEQLE